MKKQYLKLMPNGITYTIIELSNQIITIDEAERYLDVFENVEQLELFCNGEAQPKTSTQLY